MTAVGRNNVKVLGSGARTLMFAHGYGCDQNMGRHVVPSFTERVWVWMSRPGSSNHFLDERDKWHRPGPLDYEDLVSKNGGKVFVKEYIMSCEIGNSNQSPLRAARAVKAEAVKVSIFVR